MKDLRRRAHNGLANILKKLTLKKFTNWRWCTIDDVLKEINTIFASLSTFFREEPFRNMRNATLLRKTLRALKEMAWRWQKKFVTWYSDWLCSLLRWQGGCDCHDPEDKSDEAQNCFFRGRRLKTAYTHACRHLDAGLAESRSWDAAYFGGSQAVLDAAVACVASTYTSLKQQLRYLDEPPLLWARMREPGVVARAIEWYDNIPEAQHELYDKEFLSPVLEGSLRDDAIAARDTGVFSPRLVRAALSGRIHWDLYVIL